MNPANVMESNTKHICDIVRAFELFSNIRRSMNSPSSAKKSTQLTIFLTCTSCIACLHVPEVDGLIIASTDEPLAVEEKGEGGMTLGEADGLRWPLWKFGFAVVEGAVQQLPKNENSE